MLKPLEEESIHSLIFRTHKMFGISNFSNLITSNGKWKPFPRISNSTLHFYEPINDAMFLRLLREIGISPTIRKMFEDPFAYRSALKQFFFRKSDYFRFSTTGIRIMYCPLCIEEQIRIHGHGFLRGDWSYNTQCKVHSTPMSYFGEGNTTQAVDRLNILLRGEQPKNVNRIDSRRLYYRSPSKDVHLKKVDYIMPCLKDKFIEFVIDNRYKFPKFVSDDISTKLHNSTASDFQISKHFVLAETFNSLKKHKIESFKQFWQANRLETRVHTGIIKKESISEDILKSKDANCEECLDLRCSISQYSRRDDWSLRFPRGKIWEIIGL